MPRAGHHPKAKFASGRPTLRLDGHQGLIRDPGGNGAELNRVELTPEGLDGRMNRHRVRDAFGKVHDRKRHPPRGQCIERLAVRLAGFDYVGTERGRGASADIERRAETTDALGSRWHTRNRKSLRAESHVSEHAGERHKPGSLRHAIEARDSPQERPHGSRTVRVHAAEIALFMRLIDSTSKPARTASSPRRRPAARSRQATSPRKRCRNARACDYEHGSTQTSRPAQPDTQRDMNSRASSIVYDRNGSTASASESPASQRGIATELASTPIGQFIFRRYFENGRIESGQKHSSETKSRWHRESTSHINSDTARVLRATCCRADPHPITRHRIMTERSAIDQRLAVAEGSNSGE